MANLFTPTGFAPLSLLPGATGTFGQGRATVSRLDAVPLFRGDPLVRLSTGYVTRATPGTTQIHGIFVGCEYISTSQGKTVFNNYWPGSDAAQDVNANVIILPDTTFVVQTGNGGPATFADVGSNINFAIGTGNTFTQLSGAYADYATLGTAATLPFRILGIAPNNGENGTDPTTPFNKIIVSFNNTDFTSQTGI